MESRLSQATILDSRRLPHFFAVMPFLQIGSAR